MDRGKRFNQNFEQLPIFKIVLIIRYKAELHGIKIVEISEEFTSMASFLDSDPVPDRKSTRKKTSEHSDVTFSGKRIKRGLYISKGGKNIHANVNGAYNIVRKACPGAFTSNGIPVKLYTSCGKHTPARSRAMAFP